MTAPEQPTWHMAEDPEGEPTLWFGATAVLRKLDLFRSVGGKSDRAKQAFAFHLWDVLTTIHAPDEATVERLAEAVDDQLNGDALADGTYYLPDSLGERVAQRVLAALAGAAAPHERDGEVGADG